MKKTFCKHYVKRNNLTLKLEIKDGKPVVGDFIRETRITDETANELNAQSSVSGYMWVEKDTKPTTEEIKAELWEKINEKIESGELKEEDKPHHASGVDKLKSVLGE